MHDICALEHSKFKRGLIHRLRQKNSSEGGKGVSYEVKISEAQLSVSQMYRN